ncbi:MAG: Crp/Fnr family transcriptional regulator [Bacteroidales bacterium]|nr:Crp/Fnr family transcriptional regulator [Bacteroidales bacterium]MBN2756742.1 Crp/Fnr family transcriptional regulator [Bacteroidales bacterium]
MNQHIIRTNCIDCNRILDCFTQVIDDSEDFLNQQKVQINYKKGETIIKEGTSVSSIYYILDGLVKLYLEGSNKNIMIKVLNSSDFLGLTSLFGDKTYNFSATALSDTTICSIELDNIRNLFAKSCKFAHESARWYCENYNLMFTKCYNLGLKQLNGRLANTLIYLNEEKFKSDDIYTHLTRKDLAELSGTSVESVVRILSEFNDEKIIKISGKKIEITNLDLLKKICKSG